MILIPYQMWLILPHYYFLLSTYLEFAMIMELRAGTSMPGVTDPVIQLACLDASLTIVSLFK